MINTENKLLEKYNPNELIAYLSEFILPQRFSQIADKLDFRTRYMTVCLENIFHPQNASAIVRSCEAFGVQDIYAIESLVDFSPNANIVRGTDKWVDIHKSGVESENPSLEMIQTLKAKGYRIVATSPHDGDFTPETFDVTKGKFALVFGTEHAGISQTVIENADEFIRIPMYGFVESLNVSVCAAILLHVLTEKLHGSNVSWKLNEDEKLNILFRWLFASVKDSKRILQRGGYSIKDNIKL